MKLALSGPSRRRSLGASFSVLLLVFSLLPATRALAQSVTERRFAAYQKRHAEERQTFVRELADVAKYCQSVGLTTDAASLRKYARSLTANAQRIAALPRDVQPEVPRALPETERQWRLKFRKAKSDYANALYKLARDVLNGGFPSYAYELIRETAVVDPDHTSARRMLGYVRAGTKWVTPYEKYKADKGEVWHKKFGWLPKSHVARYEKGERYYVPRGGSRGNWIKAEYEAQLRRNFNNAWQVRTEHFLVKTNHSLEEGVRVAGTLEEYYRYFFQTFAGFFNSRQQIKKLFAGGSLASRTKPYEVHYYREKKEYVDELRERIPNIAITNGLYLTNTRIAYFFHSDGVDNTDTLYHESTHQILYESLKQQRAIALKHHFWIVEGISCYMESFRSRNGVVEMGDPKHVRIQNAQYRYVTDKFRVPLKDFERMGMQAFQTSHEIRKLYSQASGLAKFFMDYDNGRYRDALMEHLSQVYRGAAGRRPARVQSLSVLTGVSYDELDRQYGEYISNLKTR